MQDTIGVPVKHVSETAFMVAAWRAAESRRPDACFQDPLAELLAGEYGEAIAKKIPGGNWGDWFMALRTSAMDELIIKLIHNGVDTVLNLAAGLDTRPYRLDVPATLKWFEADLQGIIEYKSEKLRAHTPRCQLERTIVDLRQVEHRNALFSKVAAGSRQTLVITEGLLYYLTQADVVSLGKAIKQQQPFKWWMMDIASPGMFGAMSQSWNTELASDDVRFLYIPQSASEFYENSGWAQSEFRSYLDQNKRLGRTAPTGFDEKLPGVVSALEDSGILVVQQS